MPLHLPDGGEIHRGMLVDDVRAQGDVVGRGHVRLVGLIEHAILKMRKFLRVLVHVGRQRAAVAESAPRALLNGLVHPAARFLPHAEGTVLDGRGHMFGGAAQIAELKIMDRAGAVAGQMGDDALLDEGR